MLPPLTEDEYRALKADIEEHGIVYPIVIDEEDKVLDGVHRLRIATELGIDLPVARQEGLSDDHKLHLAMGLNMRRRHLDIERRRALVLSLRKEQGLSLRKMASITGWSKSQVARDLKPPEKIVSWDEMMAEIDEIKDEQIRLAELIYSVIEEPAKLDGPPATPEQVADHLGWEVELVGATVREWRRYAEGEQTRDELWRSLLHAE